MKKSNAFFILCFGLIFFSNSQAMGLRSFVALPLDEKGKVVRVFFEHRQQAEVNKLISQAAYGISDKQTLFLGFPIELTPDGSQLFGDVSVLYRYIAWKDDQLSGTNRLGLLGGVIVPTEKHKNIAIQAGFVFTHFKNRHEIDIDALYQQGIGRDFDNGRYDLSWQYRLFPSQYPEWGITQELYGVLELNGRWNGRNLTHQLTTGLQWIHQSWVLESGVIRNLNNENEWQYILGVRIHF